MYKDELYFYFKLLPYSVQVHSIQTSQYALLLLNHVPEWNDYFSINDKSAVETAIKKGALYHDIGKLVFSKDILDSEEKLDDFEWQYIKKHPVYARRLINRICQDNQLDGPQIQIINDMSTYHHERWDGRGYPYGLSEEDIPFSAQLCAVADAFDAMTCHRNYKELLSVERAAEVINCNSATQFSPKAIEIFNQAYNDFVIQFGHYFAKTLAQKPYIYSPSQL